MDESTAAPRRVCVVKGLSQEMFLACSKIPRLVPSEFDQSGYVHGTYDGVSPSPRPLDRGCSLVVTPAQGITFGLFCSLQIRHVHISHVSVTAVGQALPRHISSRQAVPSPLTRATFNRQYIFARLSTIEHMLMLVYNGEIGCPSDGCQIISSIALTTKTYRVKLQSAKAYVSPEVRIGVNY